MPWRRESRLREAIGRVAPFVGSRPEDLVFVPNVTTGLNAVLRSVPLGPGDEVVITDLGYGAVALAAGVVTREQRRDAADRGDPYPLRDAGDVVAAIVTHAQRRTRSWSSSTTSPRRRHSCFRWPRSRPSATPAACRCWWTARMRRARLRLDIPAHSAPIGMRRTCTSGRTRRVPAGSCGREPEHQASLRHPIVSWGSGQGLSGRVRITRRRATRPAIWPRLKGSRCCASGASARSSIYMHGLALRGRSRADRRWGTTLDAPHEMIGAMVTVPLPEGAGRRRPTRQSASDSRCSSRITSRCSSMRGAERLWVRVSAQVYNDRSDIMRLADAVYRRLVTRLHFSYFLITVSSFKRPPALPHAADRAEVRGDGRGIFSCSLGRHANAVRHDHHRCRPGADPGHPRRHGAAGPHDVFHRRQRGVGSGHDPGACSPSWSPSTRSLPGR